MYKGIDYGLGKTNIDTVTGIRFGVLSVQEVMEAWCTDSEPIYTCENCEEECMCDPTCWVVNDTEYLAHCGEDNDIFIERSPYFTYAQFCSPCAPGACYLANAVEPDTNNRAYCFGPEWFEGKPPYPIYSVETGELIVREGK